jgi:hypothetical protein
MEMKRFDTVKPTPRNPQPLFKRVEKTGMEPL